MATHKLITNRQVCELIQQGKTTLAISKVLGCSIYNVNWHKKQAQDDEQLMEEFPLARIKKYNFKPKKVTSGIIRVCKNWYHTAAESLSNDKKTGLKHERT